MGLILRFLICVLLGLIIICVPTAYELVSEDHASHGALNAAAMIVAWVAIHFTWKWTGSA
jgi:hypothetical protein